MKQGVITGISTNISMEQSKENLKGGKIKQDRRLKTRNGERTDSLSIVMKFNVENLPSKVYVGYMSYEVRPYIPPPLRSFKCQKFGHIAAVCKGRQRFGRCDHEYGKCERGAKIKCCSCEGEHSSAFRGCEVSKRAPEIQKIKHAQEISYAKATKKVHKEADRTCTGKVSMQWMQ